MKNTKSIRRYTAMVHVLCPGGKPFRKWLMCEGETKNDAQSDALVRAKNLWPTGDFKVGGMKWLKFETKEVEIETDNSQITEDITILDRVGNLIISIAQNDYMIDNNFLPIGNELITAANDLDTIRKRLLNSKVL